MTHTSGFTSAMFEPYFDLSDAFPDVPFHIKGIEYGIRALLEDRPYPRIQAALNPSFRGQLCAAAAKPGFNVRSPVALEPSLHSARWRSFCEHIQNFDDLTPITQVRLGWLVGKLCFHEYLLELIPQQDVESIGKSQTAASLAYLRSLSRYRLWLDGEPGYQDYSIDEFRIIAEYAPPGIASIDSHYHMVSQSVKHANDVYAVEYWQERHLQAIEHAKPELDLVTQMIVMSRFYRVGGFLPQMRRDRDGTVSQMALAEDYAFAVPRDSLEDATAADEILYPVYESRIKEALWIGDIDLACERTDKLLKLSPCDPRAWLHRAQVLVEKDDASGAAAAYRKSARYAPPGGEIALFMAGQCLEILDDPNQAIDAYLSSLAIDPLGISVVERIAVLANSLGNAPLRVWSTQRLDYLTRLQEHTMPRKAEPYKNLPGPV